jgi:metal-sulfur cluster biosynthetic enzyme
MSGEMSPLMRRKLDAVLARVKEPETGRSIGDLNLVGRFRFSETGRLLQVFMNIAEPRSTCMVCTIVNHQLSLSIERILREELEKEFSDLTVEIVS